MRESRIDGLRVIGIIGIVLAHVSPPDALMHFREFDVPLMVMIMGTSYFLSQERRGFQIHYLSYYQSRIKRLLVPTWGLLCLYFPVTYLFSKHNIPDYVFSFEQMKDSFRLMDGIGYVWVVFVFLLIALMNPFFLKMSQKIKSDRQFFALLAGLYAVYLLIVRFKTSLNIFEQIETFNHFLYAAGFSFMALLGIRLKTLSTKKIATILAIAFGLYLILEWGFYDAADMVLQKYPPRTYYLSYGIFMSLTLYLLLGLPVMKSIMNHPWIQWGSTKSFDIYLWHILILFFVEYYLKFMPILDVWWIRFFVVLGVSLLLTIGYHKLLRMFKNLS